MTAVIGVLGASGGVGREAVRALHTLGYRGLRLGSRTREKLRDVRPEDTAVHVDVRDPMSLSAFASSCDLVLNCAGPSYEFRGAVAAAALAAENHCVDVMGDDPAMADLSSLSTPRGGAPRVVLSAGVLPGLSSILPRWLAGQGLETVRGLTAHSGGLEPCSPTVAEDLILSVVSGAAYGESLAAWRNGRKQSRALRIVGDADVPGFRHRAAVQPYLSAEAERLAAYLGLERAEWFNTYPGPRVWALLSRLPGRLAEGADHRALVNDVMQAAELDLAGRSPYYVMDFTLTGTEDGAPAVRRLSLRASSSYRLTALVGALAADAVLRGSVPPGVHFACDVLDPARVAEALRSDEAVERFELSRNEETTLIEEGAL